MPDLRSIYLETLARCAPERLVKQLPRTDLPRAVVAIGKCAGALLDGLATVHGIDAAFAAVPAGYRMPQSKCELAIGGHPEYTRESFEVGKKIVAFVEANDDILFLISGGGSACVELPLAPWFTQEELIEANHRLVDSGLPIGRINIVRKHLSAIKGGRLGARARRRAVSWIYSDVSTGKLRDVASGPTLADPNTNSDAAAILDRIEGCDVLAAKLRQREVPETPKDAETSDAELIADNGTLTATAAAIAAERGMRAIRWDGQIETDVAIAAMALLDRATVLEKGEVLVAGGEPTVVKRGNGRGGRCSELALRFVAAAADANVRDIAALFGSSDGADGNSGAAGIEFDSLPAQPDPASIESALAASDSFPLAASLGRPIMIPPAGNNLRDLFLLARS